MSPLAGMPSTRKTSFLLFGLAVLMVIGLRLGDVVVAGLFSFMILDLTHRSLASRANPWAARWLSLLTFMIAATGITYMVWTFVKLALHRLPEIVIKVLPKLDEFATAHGFDLPVDNLREVHELLLDALKVNYRSIGMMSGSFLRRLFQIVVGVFIAILCFMGEHPPANEAHFFDAVRREFDARVEIFMLGFEKLFTAQIIISLVNTAITGVFLLAVRLPYIHFLLLATLLLGIVPIVGNVTANAVIVGTAITVSPQLGVATFVFLVVSHKLQYFLNSRIMGSRINMPMWQVLASLLIGEAMMGFTGMILAPALLFYAREEMQSIPYEDSGARAAAAL
jgi:predicted PurR-regulated permease PerM